MPETITPPTRLPHQPPPPVEPPPVDPFGGDDGGLPERPKLKKLRLALVLAGLIFIALISTVFGMMMAVASDIPGLEDEARFKHARNSELYADSKEEKPLAKLTGNENRILLDEHEIAPYIKNAVIAVEDKRFYQHRGVDYRGIARALFQDILAQSAQQGASTITQQFVKNALAAQGDRSVFQKLREAAAAYHLERKWSKQKILTQYLNSVYFGNGAYGIESAMRTYFGDDGAVTVDAQGQVVPDQDDAEVDLNKRAAITAEPHEAAFLAGIIASPSRYDPLQDQQAADDRRDLVLKRMLEQKMITRAQYEHGIDQAVPKAGINPPQPDSFEPYFTTWVTQQLVDKYKAPRVFGGGMKITTTLDLDLQKAARSAAQKISGVGPAVSIVTIENKTGEVKALVGGESFRERPFNLATNGHRQPGSAFKPFILLAALKSGKYGPGTTFSSNKKAIPYRETNGKKDIFVVNNYEDQYLGVASLSTATAQSDNSVFAELGMKIGTKKIARLAQRMGIKTKLSTNPSMTLGGLKQGVTPLEMAFAYSTLANGGQRVCSKLASYKCGPVGIEKVEQGGEVIDRPERKTTEVFSKKVADLAKLMLRNVVMAGTGKRAQVGEFAAGKTGTTENYGDAWFCGFIVQYTTCVWVGYPDNVRPMQTEYGGQPVAGGTWPALIWQSFMSQAIQIRDQRQAAEDAREDGEETDAPSIPALPSQPGEPSEEAGEDGADEQAPADTPREQSAPREPPARQPVPEQPRREPAPPPVETPPPPEEEMPAPGGGAEGDAVVE